MRTVGLHPRRAAESRNEENSPLLPCQDELESPLRRNCQRVSGNGPYMLYVDRVMVGRERSTLLQHMQEFRYLLMPIGQLPSP